MKHLFGITIIYVFLLVAIFSLFKDFGVSWDEPFYRFSGEIVSGHFFDTAFILENIPMYHLLTHGLLVDGIIYSISEALKGAYFDNFHLVKAVFSSLAVIVIYFIAKLTTKFRTTPILATILLITFPRWFGDIFDNQMDGIGVLLYGLEIYAALKIFDYKRQDRIFLLKLIFLVILTSVAFSHRVILVIPTLILFVVLMRRLFKLGILSLILTATLLISIFFLSLSVIDPYIRQVGPIGIFDKLFLAQRLTYLYYPVTLFDGMLFSTSALPWYYLIKWIAVTAPLSVIFFGTVGLLRIFKPSKKTVLIIGSMVFPVLIVQLFRPVLYDGWRQFLFLSIPLIILALWGLEMLWINIRSNRVRVMLLSGLLFSILFTVRQMVILHPYEYVYFNEFVGGLAGANGKFETDYWGKSYREAVAVLNLNLPSKTIIYRVFVCGNNQTAVPFFSENMVSWPSPKDADFVICYLRPVGYDLKNYLVIANVRRNGIPLSVIMRNNERTFE